MIFFFLVLVWFLTYVVDRSPPCTSSDPSKGVDLATLCTFPNIDWALSGWMSGTKITATPVHSCHGIVHGFLSI